MYFLIELKKAETVANNHILEDEYASSIKMNMNYGRRYAIWHSITKRIFSFQQNNNNMMATNSIILA